MAKFVFKLQSLLNIKIQKEDQIQNELGKALQGLEMERQKLCSLESEKEDLEKSISDAFIRGISVFKLKQHGLFLETIKDRIILQKESIKKAEEIVDKIREELVCAMQERKMMEKLKEKKHDEYIEENERKERSLVDEVVSYKYSTLRSIGGEYGSRN